MSQKYIGKETAVEVNGKTYTLSRMTRKILNEWLEWAEPQLVNPLDVVKGHLDGFTKEQQDLIIKEALKAARQRRDVTSPEVQGFMSTPAGMTHLVQLLLKDHHPDVTEDEAFEVAQAKGDDFRDDVKQV